MNQHYAAFLLISMAVCFSAPQLAVAADNSTGHGHEITRLITKVKQSECTFIRNGKSYSADKAAKFLRFKFKRAKDDIFTSEDFISQLATKSSTSNKPYKIQCEGKKVNTGAQWLQRQLQALRSSG